MEDSRKVFRSNITRSENRIKNNLYELVSITPAEPLKLEKKPNVVCSFVPNTGKYYIPKRKPTRLRVKTVGDIRKLFEKDTYELLGDNLIKQEKCLLKKIRLGSSGNESTKVVAKKVLKSASPISRSAWDMLININPEEHPNSKQFVLWNGKYIKVNGSRGGINKLIYQYDLSLKKTICLKRSLRKNVVNRRKGLLRNSLDVKLKPGPLGKKTLLDYSHQKYHVGKIALTDLPKPGLDIEPRYGTALDPLITRFVNKLRKEDGIITPKWAEFAVSVLGKNVKSNAVLTNKECVTFGLNYNNDQHRVLMRRYIDDNSCEMLMPVDSLNKCTDLEGENVLLPEIKKIMDKILDSVEININEDDFFTKDDEYDLFIQQDLRTSKILPTSSLHLREKVNKKKFCELDRLDVTVIRLPETMEKAVNKACNKTFCYLGCVCESIEGTYNLRRHCGRIECMFECTCDFSNFNNINSLGVDSTGLIPALANLDNAINVKLAKEEQKFHQTVIVTGEKRVLLKSEKRNCKTPKRYADFFNKTCPKYDSQKQSVAINLVKLNFDNIEPWCMVHSLYKCFCKGKLTESSTSSLNETLEKVLPDADKSHMECSNTNYIRDKSYQLSCDKYLEKNQDYIILKPKFTNSISSKEIVNSDIRISKRHKTISISDSSDSTENVYTNSSKTSARTTPYAGRKFSDGYYQNTNVKINEMEKNDKYLKHKMDTILQNISGNEEPTSKNITSNISRSDFTVVKRDEAKVVIEDTLVSEKTSEIKDTTTESSDEAKNLIDFKLLDDVTTLTDDEEGPKSKKKKLINESKLVAWLVANYLKHKQRVDQGLAKSVLLPPENGKVALHAWDFILSRYRERKNIFLISKQKPFRIFMAVKSNDPFFDNCININDIRFADLNNYPQTVKNLLLNSNNDFKDSFCVLRGLARCWELVGMVAKTKNNNTEEPNITTNASDESKLSPNKQADGVDTEQKSTLSSCMSEVKIKSPILEKTESSKWFIMTVEKDFSEIRFYKKGFFVKYESIIKAIKVACVSGKTVRLSSTKCMENSPQFGIYAIAYTKEHCVFVGPYEMNESLGIESVKNYFAVDKFKKTRGFWIKTNKIDNDKVINNPLSFLPPKHEEKETELLETKSLLIQNQKEDSSPEKNSPPKSVPNINVIPIKIAKSGVFRLLPDGTIDNMAHKPKLVPINMKPSFKIPKSSSSIPNASHGNYNKSSTTISKTSGSTSEQNLNIEISDVYSICEPVCREYKNKTKNASNFVSKQKLSSVHENNVLEITGEMHGKDGERNTNDAGKTILKFQKILPDAVSEIKISETFSMLKEQANSNEFLDKFTVEDKFESLDKSNFNAVITNNEQQLITDPVPEVSATNRILILKTQDKISITEPELHGSKLIQNKIEDINERSLILDHNEKNWEVTSAIKTSNIFIMQEDDHNDMGPTISKPYVRTSDTNAIEISEIIFVQNKNEENDSKNVSESHTNREIGSELPDLDLTSAGENENIKRKTISYSKPEISEAIQSGDLSKEPERAMFILKPEEINKKLLQNKLFSEPKFQSDDISMVFRNMLNQSMTNDFNESAIKVYDQYSYKNMFCDAGSSSRKFSKRSQDNSLVDVLVISDEEDRGDFIDENDINNIWLQCKDDEIGWIPAKINSRKLLSFKLPTGEYSKFSSEEKAFSLLDLCVTGMYQKEAVSSKDIDPRLEKHFVWTIVESPLKLQGTEINFKDKSVALHTFTEISTQDVSPPNLTQVCDQRRSNDIEPTANDLKMVEESVKTELPEDSEETNTKCTSPNLSQRENCYEVPREHEIPNSD